MERAFVENIEISVTVSDVIRFWLPGAYDIHSHTIFGIILEEWWEEKQVGDSFLTLVDDFSIFVPRQWHILEPLKGRP
jgi:hypothetical protein